MCCTIGKYVFIVANIIFLLAGVALIGVGTAYRINFNDITDLIPDEYNVDFAPTATIVLGVVIFLIAFFGCCGAIKQNRVLILTYAVILILILIAQVTIGIMVFVRIQSDEDYSLKQAVRDETNKLFGKYALAGDNKAIHVVQYTFKCCGVENPNYWVSHGVLYPYSCCGSDEETSCPVPEYTTGCVEKVYDFLESSAKVIGGVAIGVIVTEILGILVACVMSSQIKKRGKIY